MRNTADLHTHTIASGHAYSTVMENARAAAQKGLWLIAMTDHGPAMPGGPHAGHFGNLRSLPPVIEGVRVLHGVEANIIDASGRLDLPDDLLETLDFVAAGFHPEAGYAGGNIGENTRALAGAMANPLVNMIVHPCDRRFPVDLRSIVSSAARYGVILEINNRSFSPLLSGIRDTEESCVSMARLAKKRGVPLALDSDAHFAEEVGDTSFIADILDKAALAEGDAITTDHRRLLADLDRRKDLTTRRAG